MHARWASRRSPWCRRRRRRRLPPPLPLLLGTPPRGCPSPIQACSKYEYVKQYELDDRLLPGCWVVVRLDGKGFTKCARCRRRLICCRLPGLPLRSKLVF